MKKALIFPLSIIAVPFFSFKIIEGNTQQNYWPLVRGNWYWANENKDDYTTTFVRKGTYDKCMGFISQDSCFITSITGEDKYKRVFYKWHISNDTIRILKSRDTLVLKILSLSSSEFKFKQIF